MPVWFEAPLDHQRCILVCHRPHATFDSPCAYTLSIMVSCMNDAALKAMAVDASQVGKRDRILARCGWAEIPHPNSVSYDLWRALHGLRDQPYTLRYGGHRGTAVTSSEDPTLHWECWYQLCPYDAFLDAHVVNFQPKEHIVREEYQMWRTPKGPAPYDDCSSSSEDDEKLVSIRPVSTGSAAVW